MQYASIYTLGYNPASLYCIIISPKYLDQMEPWDSSQVEYIDSNSVSLVQDVNVLLFKTWDGGSIE